MPSSRRSLARRASLRRFDPCPRPLANLGIPYTGSGPAASARAFDKAWTKAILRAAGLPVAPDLLLEWPFRAKDVKRMVRRAESIATDGLVVKPVREGSSVGVT